MSAAAVRQKHSMRLINLDSASITHDDRRRSTRFAVRCQCWLESNEASIFGPTADIGLGGLFLRTAVPLPEGMRLKIALKLGKKANAVVANGIVTRALRAQHGRRHGVGVAFLEILDGRTFLESFLGAPLAV